MGCGVVSNQVAVSGQGRSGAWGCECQWVLSQLRYLDGESTKQNPE